MLGDDDVVVDPAARERVRQVPGSAEHVQGDGLAPLGCRIGAAKVRAEGVGWRGPRAYPAQAVAMLSASASPSSWMASSRILYFWTLPVTVIGKPVAIFT